MQYVYLFQATEEQYSKMMKFLDDAIKKDGLTVIQDVVDVYNVLVSGRKLALQEEQDQQVSGLTETNPLLEVPSTIPEVKE